MLSCHSCSRNVISGPEAKSAFELLKHQFDFSLNDSFDTQAIGDLCDRRCSLVKIDGGSIALNVMVYAKGASKLRPLVVLNSIDFPMPPSKGFCETMRLAGLQVIYIERPGFGCSRGLPEALLTNHAIETGAAVMTEAAVIQRLLSQLQLGEFVLLCMGSSNPVGYRLAKLNQKVALTVFSNAMFNQDAWSVFRPEWFQHSLKQAMRSRTAMKLSILGTKLALKRSPSLFYRQVLQKSAGDLKYFEANKQDFSAASLNYQNMTASMIAYDVRTSMQNDPSLSDNFFENDNCVTFTSIEADANWRRGLQAESERLSLPITFASEGDFFAPYLCPGHLIKTIEQYG